jgi:hypothetical protein
MSEWRVTVGAGARVDTGIYDQISLGGVVGVKGNSLFHSVVGGAGLPLYVNLDAEAADISEAAEKAESIVAAALTELGWPGLAITQTIRDAKGAVCFEI